MIYKILKEQIDGDVPGPKGPFASRQHTVTYARDKFSIDQEDVEEKIEELEEEGKIVYWHGLIVPLEDEYVDEVIRQELEKDYSRRILIRKLRKER